MKHKLFLIFITVLFLSFSPKEDIHDVEYLLQKKKLVFNESDSANVVKLFGTAFEFKKSWKHAKMRSGPDWNWTYQFLNYPEYGIRFKLTKQVGIDKVAKLSSIRIYSAYEYSILDKIKIGEADFAELREKYTPEKLIYSEDISDSLVTVSQKYENYNFTKEIKIILDTSMNEQRAILFLDSLTNNLKIDYIDIYGDK